jgi:hypothetical protein
MAPTAVRIIMAGIVAMAHIFKINDARNIEWITKMIWS